MKTLRLCWPLLGVLLATGCSSVVPPVGEAYALVAPGPNTPNIDGGTTPVSAPPPAISALDSAVDTIVHQALENDPRLAKVSHDVSVSCRKGAVTLAGRVPTARDRDAVVNRVAKLPCVDEVNDQLVVSFIGMP